MKDKWKRTIIYFQKYIKPYAILFKIFSFLRIKTVMWGILYYLMSPFLDYSAIELSIKNKVSTITMSLMIIRKNNLLKISFIKKLI